MHTSGRDLGRAGVLSRAPFLPPTGRERSISAAAAPTHNPGNDVGSPGEPRSVAEAESRCDDARDGSLTDPRRRSSDAEIGKPLIRISRRTAIVTLVAFAAVCVAAGDVTLSVFRDRAEQRVDEDQRKRSQLDAVILSPLITDELLRHDPTAIARIREVSTALETYGGVESMTVTTEDGRVVWADDPALLSRAPETLRKSAGDVRSGPFDSVRIFEADENPVPETTSVAFETRVETAQGVPAVIRVAYANQTSARGGLVGDSLFSAAFAAGLLLITTSIVLYGLSGRNRSRRERRERQRLVDRLASTADAERQRIAGALHDGAVQELVGVSLSLGAIATAAPPPLDASLRELADTTRTAVTRVRSVLSGIYPVPVPPTGWLAGVEDLVEALRAAGVVVKVDAPPARYSSHSELLMLRVAREALRNVAVHAHAHSVSISVSQQGPLLRLAIADDGIGFDYRTTSANAATGHVGLQLVRDLACEFGAALTISSAPGSGTVLVLEVKEEQ